jgi:hypothetical protein
VGYVSVGVLVAVWLQPLAWVPFVAGGFLLSVYQTDGRSLDEFTAGFVRFHLTRHGRSPRPRAIARRWNSATRARLSGGPWVAAIGAGGLPVAYLPPEEARALFDGYRGFLRTLEGGLYLRIASEPMSDRPFVVSDRCPVPDSAEAARRGYSELVRLLCRRRRRRVVDLVVWSPSADPVGRVDLERSVRSLCDLLEGLGLAPQRRIGRRLWSTLTQVGWTVEGME